MSYYFERPERAIVVETLTLWDRERTTQEPGQCDMQKLYKRRNGCFQKAIRRALYSPERAPE